MTIDLFFSALLGCLGGESFLSDSLLSDQFVTRIGINT